MVFRGKGTYAFLCVCTAMDEWISVRYEIVEIRIHQLKFLESYNDQNALCAMSLDSLRTDRGVGCMIF